MTQEAQTQNVRSALRRKLLAAAVAAAVIVIGVVVFWQTATRLERLDRRLSSAEERTQAVLRQMTEYSRELQLAIERAREAQQQADESQKARAEAESTAQRAQVYAAQAQVTAAVAQRSAEQTREQLEEVRQRRTQELDRMQKALNRIAPTRRTPLGMVVELADESFKFDFDKATLRPENREMLSRIAGVLLASTGYRLMIYGHTDDIGTDEYNQGLSERRAQAVAGYLIKAGVPQDIITTKGYGKTSPRVRGETRDARQQNRRVEIGVVDTIINYHGMTPAKGAQ